MSFSSPPNDLPPPEDLILDNDDNIDEQQEAYASSIELMALDIQGSKLGCAYLHQDGSIYLLSEDLFESFPHLDLMRALLIQHEPQQVLATIAVASGETEWNVMLRQQHQQVNFVSRADFTLEHARTRLQQTFQASMNSLMHGNDDDDAAEQEKVLFERLIGSGLNNVSVGCAGALLNRTSKDKSFSAATTIKEFSM